MPGTELAKIEGFYLVPPDDERDAEALWTLLASNLERRGYSVSDSRIYTESGEEKYVFEYATDWHWDVTWYLIDLRVAIYDPADNTLIAQAQSHQSSLARKGIDTIVERAMAALFNDPEHSNGARSNE